MSVSEATAAASGLRRMNSGAHLNGSARQNGSPIGASVGRPSAHGAVQAGAATKPVPKPRKGTSRKVRDARIESQPVELLLSQLREIIVGPHERLSEARFEEMLDIMAEQQDENEGRFRAIETDVSEMKIASARMERLFSTFDVKVEDLALKVDDQTREVHEAYGKAITELKSDFSTKMEMIAGTLQQCLKDLELETRKELLELSSTLMAHVTDEDKRWEKERDNSSLIVNQRIAQWRAEIEDDRKQDMDNVASSLMEIGQRMLALRKG